MRARQTLRRRAKRSARQKAKKHGPGLSCEQIFLIFDMGGAVGATVHWQAIYGSDLAQSLRGMLRCKKEGWLA